MTPDEREIRLTAYALDDPGLSAADRADVERELETDLAAQKCVAEIRTLAALLATGLAAEQAAIPTIHGVTMPATRTPPRSGSWWPTFAAAAMLFVGGAAFFTLGQPRPRDVAQIVPETAKPEAAPRVEPEELALTQTQPGLDAFQEGKATAEKLAAPAPPPTQALPTPAAMMPGFGGGGFPGGPGDGIGGFGGGGIGGIGGGGIGGGIGGGGGFGGGGFGGGGPGSGGIGGGGPGSGNPVVLGYNGIGIRTLPNDPEPMGAAVAATPQFDRSAAMEKRAESVVPSSEFGAGRFREYPVNPGAATGDQFAKLIENDFVTVAGLDALSTFGVDVDTASYSIVRNYVSRGMMPPKDAVRLEEIVNYFPYADAPPVGDDPFAVTVEVGVCPWQPAHRLARIGLKAKDIPVSKRPPSNLVFLIDVSGSMNEPNKLPLVRESLKLLVNQLGENDRVALVVYAGNVGLVLDSTSATNKRTILDALDRLEAGGSTNGAGGLQLAYDVAVKNFIKNGTNRVILCTDGDWNVGTTSTEDLVKLIEEKRTSGVFLSVFGFGMGNLRDEMMVKLAGKGNGNYGYIDTLREASKVFVEQTSATLVTVAKDVKIQVEFNPAAVRAYRLLGYEKRILAAADFANDKKDAGEMGAGHTVTALYELIPVEAAGPAPGVEPLRYQPAPAGVAAAAAPEKPTEMFVLKMRHKKPDSDQSTLREQPVPNVVKPLAETSEDFRLSSAAAAFALILRDSPHKGQATFGSAFDLAEGREYIGSYRAEFRELVRRAQQLTGHP